MTQLLLNIFATILFDLGVTITFLMMVNWHFSNFFDIFFTELVGHLQSIDLLLIIFPFVHLYRLN